MSDLRDKIADVIALHWGETDSPLDAADAVLSVLDLDKVRAEAQVEALREAATSLNDDFQDIPAWTEAYLRGERTHDWMEGSVRTARSIISVLNDRVDRIAREAGIETGGH